MGFVSTLVYLFIIGFLIQIWYRKSLREKHEDAKFLIGLVLILGIWGVQFLIYFNILPLPSWLSKVVPWIQDQSGRTWLWNSWQLWGAQPVLVMPRGVGQIAVMLALSYPFFYFFGTWVAKGLFGNKTYQRGLFGSGLLRPEKGEASAPKLQDKSEA